MSDRQLEYHRAQAQPFRVLLLSRSGGDVRSGSEIMKRFQSLIDVAQQHFGPTLAVHRRFLRGPSQGPDRRHWSEILSHLRDIDAVVIEDLTRVSRSPDDIEAFLDCLRSRGIQLVQSTLS